MMLLGSRPAIRLSQRLRSVASPMPRPQQARQRCSTTAAVSAREFLEACSSQPGLCRFIVMGDGAIMEAVAPWSQMKYKDIPGRGMLATVSTADQTFECHLTLSKLKEAKLAKSKSKMGAYDTYAIRFVKTDGAVLLVVLLHGSPPGTHAPAELAAWTALHAQFGETVQFE